MNFEDEPYVRLYTRKTLTWKLLGWEGRAVLQAMIGEFDAAGIFDIRGDAAHCIAAVTDLPLEIVRAGLARLVETETWVVTARSITWRSYEEAQNCRRSDRLRQRESRRARSAQSVTDVTTRHAGSQPSQAVTPSHPPSAPSHPPSLPSTQERETRAPEVPEVPGLQIVVPLPAPVFTGLQPSKRDQAAGAIAPGARRFDPAWDPHADHRIRGHELGLTDAEILAEAEDCRRKLYPHGFLSEDDQFFRELQWLSVEIAKTRFKNLPKAQRDDFETPGHRRRA